MDNQLFYPHIRWTWFKKLLVRFAVIFFGLLILPILSYIGDDLYPKIAKNVFSIPVMSLEQTGSGDMYYNYIELFFCFCVAAVLSLIWSLYNKKEKNYDTLLHWFLIFIRYYLAYSLISYGYAKIFYNQFGAPGLNRLLQTYGESSPMGITWTFMGTSKAYTVFSGLAELFGGVLLLFRRTTLLGSLVAFAVMFNVMMLNYCYDVPVKLYSTELVILTLLLIVCNGHHLWKVLWGNAVTANVYYKPLFQKKQLNIAGMIVKVLVVFYLIGLDGYNQYQSVAEYGPDAPKAPLYGIYKPVHLYKNGNRLALFSDSAQWKYLVVDYPDYATVIQVNDRKISLPFTVDTIQHVININDGELHSILSYTAADSLLTLKGILKNDTVTYVMSKVNLRTFRLINRSFNWVNEYPYNR